MSAMRLALCTLGLLALGASAAATRPVPPLSAKAEKALEGRRPGKPVNCVSLTSLGSSEIVDQTAIIYKSSRKLWYVNRPDGGNCPALQRNRTLVTHLTMSQLCSLDIVRVIDSSSPVEFGSCGLGQFVPYTK
jgi:hypothetical protein